MDYFLSVGKKNQTKNRDIFDAQGADRELLLTHSEKRDPKQIVAMFRQWQSALFSGFNIAVLGRESKFSLLETFRERCLMSSDFEIIRLHGFKPVSLEKFNYTLFGKKRFQDYISSTKKHHIFFMHNFELLQKDSQQVCEQVLEMYLLNRSHVHIVASFGHLLASRICDPLKLSHNFMAYQYYHGDSYCYERMNTIGDLEHVKTAIFDRQLDLQALRDVYQALQKHAKQIMIYIIKKHIELSESGSCDALVEHPLGGAMIPTKKSKSKEAQVDHLKFEDLMTYCEKEFIARRVNTLKNHLGELEDHRIIELDNTKTKIYCLLSVESCKNFIDQLATNDLL